MGECRYRDYRVKQEELHKAWVERKKIHDEKVAKGEPVEPLDRDPTEVREVGAWDLVKILFWTLVIAALAGKFVTGSYTWEYQGKWAQVKTYMPVRTIYAFLWGVTLLTFEACRILLGNLEAACFQRECCGSLMGPM